MKQGYKIGLATLIFFGVGAAFFRKMRKTKSATETPNPDEPIKRIYQEVEDAFFTKPIKIERLVKTENPIVPAKKPAEILLVDKTGQTSSIKEFYKMLMHDFDRAQITVCNNSNEVRTITLWSGNAQSSVSPPLTTDLTDQVLVNTIDLQSTQGELALLPQHPQGIISNPINGLVYIPNQLSNSVTVTDALGNIQTTIELSSSYLGYASPVDVAVHPITGYAYIIGSVSNLVYVVDDLYNVVHTIEVGVRPIDIEFNPINGLLYVANLVSNELSVIDPDTNTVTTTIATGENPMSISIDPVTGDIFVANSNSNYVLSIDKLHLTIDQISTSDQLTSIVYNSGNQLLYGIDPNSGDLTYIDPKTQTSTIIPNVLTAPGSLTLDPRNNYIYVVNSEDLTTTAISPDNSIQSGITYGGGNFTINQQQNLLYVSNPLDNTIKIWGFASESSQISINEDYYQMREDFKDNPIILKHAKFVNDNNSGISLLNVSNKTPSGKFEQKTISLNKYANAQNSSNVAELFEIESHIIDGRSTWELTLGPQQCCTALIYYKQFNKHEQFNKH